MMNISNEILIAALILLNISALKYYRALIDKLRREMESAQICERAVVEKLRVLHKKKQHALEGRLDQTQISSKIAQKLADRAFNMASSANLATMHLQKSLQIRPAFVHKKVQLHNELTQDKVMETVGGSPNYGSFDWIYPILSDDERDVLDKVLEHNAKSNK